MAIHTMLLMPEPDDRDPQTDSLGWRVVEFTDSDGTPPSHSRTEFDSRNAIVVELTDTDLD